MTPNGNFIKMIVRLHDIQRRIGDAQLSLALGAMQTGTMLSCLTDLTELVGEIVEWLQRPV
jgi:hypothetical protein